MISHIKNHTICMNEENKAENNEVLTDPEKISLREVSGVKVFRFPKEWRKVFRSKLPEPMELLAHLEETSDGRIIFVAELRRK
jgi:hypothetical protein